MTNKAERARRHAKEALDEDLRDVLANEQGRRVIWKLMDDAGLMGRVNERDTHQSQRTLGRRDVGLDLHDWVMRVSPRAMLDMLTARAHAMEPIDENDDDDETTD